jgi:hypothetical protein
MKIKLFPIVSSLHEEERINKGTKELLDELIMLSNHDFEVCDIDTLYDGDLALILIQSGGSEQLFLDNLDKLKGPYYLLTYGHNNSLAASLEILSFIKDNNLEGEVLHGSNEYLANRIDELLLTKNRSFRYGVIGKPSDWLIASNVNYYDASRLHGIELVDIEISEVEEVYNSINDDLSIEVNKYDFNKDSLNEALKLHKALTIIKDKYSLNGFTIRCFDLLSSLKTTSCLSLGLMNSLGLPCACEGDIPSLLSMHVLNQITGFAGFQANPSRIDVNKKQMVLAHCTLPLNMVEKYSLNTHFESGIGVAIKGELKEDAITIFKLSKNLKDYFVTTGKIIRNLNETNLCRTQIEISVDENIEYFLTRPYGNHHIIVYGDYKKEIENYMKGL